MMKYTYFQGPDFDDMSSFFPYKIDDAIQYINLGYGAQAPKIVILYCIFSSFCVFLSFRSYFQGLLHFKSFFQVLLNLLDSVDN